MDHLAEAAENRKSEIRKELNGNGVEGWFLKCYL